MVSQEDLQKIVEWAFMAVVSGGIGMGAKFLLRLAKSIDALNQNMATIIEKTTWQSRTLETHEKRIETLETKRGRS